MRDLAERRARRRRRPRSSPCGSSTITRIASRGLLAGTSRRTRRRTCRRVAGRSRLLRCARLPGHRVAGDRGLGAGALEDDVAEHRHHPLGGVPRDDARALRAACTRWPPIFSTRCGVTRTPPFAIVAYAETICIGVTAMPCPIGTVPIVEPDHWSSGSTMPGSRPGSRRRSAAEPEPLDPRGELARRRAARRS